MNAMGLELAAISAWIDADPTRARRQGEAIAAFIGVTSKRDNIIEELLDVALTALAAVELIVDNDEERFRQHLSHVSNEWTP